MVDDGEDGGDGDDGDDDDEEEEDAIFDNLVQGWCDHQWSLSCRLCACHGDGGTSVQVVIIMMT